MLPPVFRAFDKDNDSYLSPKEWVQGMSVMLRGTLDEKMECELVTSLVTGWLLFSFFVLMEVTDVAVSLPHLPLSLAVVCFSIYDLKNTGLVTREEMFHLLKTTMIKVCQPSKEEYFSTHL